MDGDFNYRSASGRLSSLHTRIIEAIKDGQRAGIVEKGSLVEFVHNKLALFASEFVDAMLDSEIEALLRGKFAARSGGHDDRQVGLFSPEESAIIRYSDRTLVKQRQSFTIDDGDQIALQKIANIAAAVRAKKEWDWEWGEVIRPLLVKNPGWIYGDAYQHLTRTGFPTPPNFDL